MEKFVVTAVAALSLSACAASMQTASNDVEVGYAPGSLGYAAIMRGDLPRAEAQLTHATNVSADDPARLLNLAHVYRKTGREAEARELYARVAQSGDEGKLELANGDVGTARELAMRALNASNSYASLR